ncbi:alkyl/aryl-sulfatase [Selenomonas ruminantium]|uniref:Alkyl sulfatase BDS1, metallo-beta-lactamase superfamily n=1 Tax=Selenomonas ruminantium TaxID=971 RepID=A0A1H0RVY8_SELRU|nr:alkyl sulfatase dimerization domain-containing protein [Selenomonas ruminantium]SDP33557.1 Alkyl sulfatase BDS1, metallo-beta-lactamase superfamily [Selenomonas ruminantium]
MREKLTVEKKNATVQTAKRNAAVYEQLDFHDKREGEFARRGLLAAPEALEIRNADGEVVWSQAAYAFLDEMKKAPDTANPSLWENTKNNHIAGLFEVTKGIYQVRGFDMANVTLIAGDTGWIVFDTSMAVETAKAAMELVEKHLGKRPVKAVVISHPHIDHFGGIKAFLTDEEAADRSLPIDEQIASGKIPVIVPQGFTKSAMEENLYAGRAMSRRAGYQYGVFLEKGPKGGLGIGIGMGQTRRATSSFILPTWEIKETGATIIIDGVEMEFQMTPGTEAPAEMNTYFPQKKALWLAENCTCTLHNLYTLRGAQVRDGNAWAKYIMEAAALYGDKTEVTFQSHNWPHWGKDLIRDYLLDTAAVYKFINDETLALLNLGYTADEIAHIIELTPMLAKNWYTRQYYGTVSHDAKAVYQKFMGWYDANPIHLHKLPPEESGKKWAQYLGLGSVEAVLEKARQDFEAGEYQWVAELTNKLVFADPGNTEARRLCADAFEQLGYQAESGPWRNCYLTGAVELRHGNLMLKIPNRPGFGGDMMENLTPEMAFDYMGILLDRQATAEENAAIRFELTDIKETYTAYLRYGVLLYAKEARPVDTVVKCPAKALLLMMAGMADKFRQAAEITGDAAPMELLMQSLNRFVGGKPGDFNIVEP